MYFTTDILVLDINFTVAGITSILTQFKSLEPYHWPGWFVAALAIVLAAIVLFTFSEPRSLKHIKGCVHWKFWRSLKLSLNLRSEWKIRLIVSFKNVHSICHVVVYLHTLAGIYRNTCMD